MIVYSCFSHKGGREHNEDYMGCFTDQDTCRQAFVLADGLGGHGQGEVASAMAVDAFLLEFKGQEGLGDGCLNRLIDCANQAVISGQSVSLAKKGMGAVLAAGLYDRGVFRALNVGDTRLYYFRDEALYQVTKDHSMSQLAVDMGTISRRDIPKSPDRNRVLRVLGDEDLTSATLYEEITPREGDGFLLCTDGAWEYLDDMEIAADLCKSENPLQWKEYLLKRILPRQKEGCDNFSMICGMFMGRGFEEV